MLYMWHIISPRPCLSVVSLITIRLGLFKGIYVSLRSCRRRWSIRKSAMRSWLTGCSDSPYSGHDRQLLLGRGARWRPVPVTGHVVYTSFTFHVKIRILKQFTIIAVLYGAFNYYINNALLLITKKGWNFVT